MTNQTLGTDADPDGFTVTVAEESGQLDANGELTFMGIPAGENDIELSGIAANCEVAGANPRLVTVVRGDTVYVPFDVGCTALAGVNSVLVSPNTAEVAVGATTTYTAQTFDADDVELTGRAIDWSVADGGIATVDAQTGVVTGVAEGSTTVTATSEGITDDAAVVVVAPPGGNLNAWTNPLGGNWGVASNWSKGAVPVATDSVVIELGGTYTVTLFQDARVAYLMVGGPGGTQALHHTGGTLTIDNAAVFDNPGSWYNLEGGTLTGGATVAVNGAFGWTAGAMTGTGSTVLDFGSASIFPSVAVLDTRDLTVGSNLAWGGTIDVRNGSTITIMAGARVEGGAVVLDHTAGATPTLNNLGLIENKPFGDGVSTFEVDFNNEGTVQVEGGTLDVVGSLFNTGTVYAEGGDVAVTGSLINSGILFTTNATVIDIDGTFEHNAGAILGGDGALDLTDATVSAFDGDVGPGSGLSPYGVLTIAGTYQPSPLSTLSVDITSFGPLNDRIAAETVVLDGALAVTVQSPPSLGDRFPIMTFTSRSGTFADVTFTDIGGGLVLDTLFAADTLWVVTESAPVPVGGR